MTDNARDAVSPSDELWMSRALELARRAANAGEVPVGAVVVAAGRVIGEGWNQPVGADDPTAHAEIIALRAAGAASRNYRLTGAALYVTLEPCLMCAGAIVHARLHRLVFGAYDPKSGAVSSVDRVLDAPYVNHRISCRGGVLAEECGRLLSAFFKERRQGK